MVTAADGLEALEILQEDKIAVVATDLKMPRMDGMELLGRIMQDDPSLPVIILTAYGTVATAVDALKKGAFDYITKPFEQDELKTIILKAVKTRMISEQRSLGGRRRRGPVPDRGRQQPHGRDPRDHPQGIAHDGHRAHHRGDGNGQGADRPRHPPAKHPERATLHQDQLRRHRGESRRKRALRLRKRGLHRRRHHETGEIRAGPQGNALSGRGRRDPAGDAGEAPPGDPGPELRAGGRTQDHLRWTCASSRPRTRTSCRR